MTGVGVTMEIEKLKQVLKMPVAPIVATVLHFLVIPFICWGLTELFNLSDIQKLTIVIFGCCPGGTLSNFFGNFSLI